MGLAKSRAYSAILAAVIFNAIIIPLLIPIALKGVTYRPVVQGPSCDGTCCGMALAA